MDYENRLVELEEELEIKDRYLKDLATDFTGHNREDLVKEIEEKGAQFM